MKFLIMTNIVFILLVTYTSSLPVDINKALKKEIKHKELLPPDHVPAAHMEHDGHINKEYHHEAFLGTLIKEGKLLFENMEGYKKLIDIYHKCDLNGNHRIEKDELKAWIHDRILEHYNNAKNESDHVFLRVDHNRDGKVSWLEYKAQLFGINPSSLKNDNGTIEDENGEFSKEIKHWKNADYDQNNFLDQHEFLAFHHPEHNKQAIEVMADEIIPSYDKNHDGKISLEEFTALPLGEVDPEEADLDKQYQEEKRREFVEDMDTNGDNIVDRHEMLSYLDPRHHQHALKEAEYLIRTSDRDRDGRISEHEMLMNYETFTGSSFNNFAKILHDEF